MERMKKISFEELKEEGKEGKESKIRREGLPFWDKPIRSRGTSIMSVGMVCKLSTRYNQVQVHLLLFTIETPTVYIVHSTLYIIPYSPK